MSPEARFRSIESELLTVDVIVGSCRTDVLAGESSTKNVNCSSPGISVEGSHIVPDGEVGQVSVCLSCEQDVSGIGFDFTRSNRIVSK